MSKYNHEISSYEKKNHMLFEKPIPYDNHWLKSLSIHRSDLFGIGYIHTLIYLKSILFCTEFCTIKQ